MEKKTSHLMLSFEWHSILRNLLRNFWIVIMAGVIAFLGVYIAENSVYKPEYKSSATLVVRAKASTSGAYTNFSASAEMANIFTEVFTQPTLKKLAAENIGSSSFDGSISASAIGETNLISITVTADSPEKAYKLLDSVLEVYPSVSKSIFSNAAIDVLVHPEMPTGPSNTISMVLRGEFAALAIMLQACAIIAISMLRDTIKTPDNFENKIDGKLLGTVSHEKPHLSSFEKVTRKKRSLLINDVFASLKFSEDYQKIAIKLEYMSKNNDSKVFTIASIAENEGKSTATANISLALASRGHKVIVIDFDVHKPSLYKIFGFHDSLRVELSDILSGKASPKDLKLFRYKKSNLRIAMNKSSRKDSKEWIGGEMTKRCIASMRKSADFIIIDTPPISVSADAMTLAKLSDKTLLIVRTDCVKSSDINDTIATINNVSNNFAGCILNNVYKPFSLFGQMGTDEGGYYSTKYGSYKRNGNYYGSNYKPEMFNSEMFDSPEV